MGIKNRLTVLLGAGDDISEYVTTNDTHITVIGKDGDGIWLQQRYTIARVSGNNFRDDSVRLTWRSLGAQARSVIEPFLSFGYNAYTNVGSGLLGNVPVVDSKVFEVVHGDDLTKMEVILSKYKEIPKNLLKLDSNNSYDILINKNNIQFNEYKVLKEHEVFEYANDGNFEFEKMEAGIFNVELQDSSDVNLGGVSCVWEDGNEKIDKCQKTMLLFKPAHIDRGFGKSKNIVHIEEPVGLHPKLLIDLSEERLSGDKCQVYVYLQLPIEIFVDKYQSSPTLLFGEHDLELPSYKLKDKSWGSEVLFELTPGKLNEVVLHTRYVEPFAGNDSINKDYFISHIEPIIFEECETKNKKLRKNPFYSKSLGLEAYFTDGTVFNHIDTKSFNISIPRPDVAEYEKIALTTVFCLVISIIYLFYKVFGRTSKRSQNMKSNSTVAPKLK